MDPHYFIYKYYVINFSFFFFLQEVFLQILIYCTNYLDKNENNYTKMNRNIMAIISNRLNLCDNIILNNIYFTIIIFAKMHIINYK